MFFVFLLAPCFLIYFAHEMEKRQSIQTFERHLYAFFLVATILSAGFDLALKPRKQSPQEFIATSCVWSFAYFFPGLLGILFYTGSPALYTICTIAILCRAIQSLIQNCKSRTTRRWAIATLYIAGPFFPEAALPIVSCIYTVIGPVAVVEFAVFINGLLNELEE